MAFHFFYTFQNLASWFLQSEKCVYYMRVPWFYQKKVYSVSHIKQYSNMNESIARRPSLSQKRHVRDRIPKAVLFWIPRVQMDQVAADDRVSFDCYINILF